MKKTHTEKKKVWLMDQNLYKICGISFLLDSKYTPVKAMGIGAYGIVW